MPTELAWFIFLIPLASFLVISLILRPFFKDKPQWSGYATILGIAASFALSLWTLKSVLAAPEHRLEVEPITWLTIGDTAIKLGLTLDGLAAVMLVVVSGVSLLIQIYSQGYMHGDPGYPRYFAFMSLFTGSMLGLVLADNLLFLYVFWELVGLCSYLLIGFWFHRPSAAAAAKKAFIVTRFGDFGFLMAILFLFFKFDTFNISELGELARVGTLGGVTLTLATLGIFAGAVGKSAQFPLHVWLPDAMEGPTPVSALIHAATMVAAGVYLVARTFVLFEGSETTLTTVAYIGGFTAIFAASMGLVMNDIKRVVAYSTISQLGYMMLGLGAGSLVFAVFHLFNHAFFKALLFLGSGSVNHATKTFDMREMGGLRRYMPWTFAVFLIAALSLAGIWPLAGFWSKDGILETAWVERKPLFFLALATVFLTAFYIFRALFLTFGGKYRGRPAHASGSAPGEESPHLHESPRVMVLPMVALAVMAVVSGWLNLGGGFGRLLGEEYEESVGFFSVLTHWLPLASLGVALAGILSAYACYSARWFDIKRLVDTLPQLHQAMVRKYWFDDLYERVLVSRLLVRGFFTAAHLFDTYVVDGTVNGVAWGNLAAGRALRRLQTGQLQSYGLAIFLGMLVIVAGYYVFGR